jgi:two-component system chemotaxis response regulator CheY
MEIMTSVIIVDDDYDCADALAECLEIKGFDVLARGANGLEAVELYKIFRPDFVLLDIFMPYYDGYYGLSKILEFDKNAKVIVISASCGREDRAKLVGLGALALVAKPYELDSLTSLLKHQMRNSQSILQH